MATSGHGYFCQNLLRPCKYFPSLFLLPCFSPLLPSCFLLPLSFPLPPPPSPSLPSPPSSLQLSLPSFLTLRATGHQWPSWRPGWEQEKRGWRSVGLSEPICRDWWNRAPYWRWGQLLTGFPWSHHHTISHQCYSITPSHNHSITSCSITVAASQSQHHTSHLSSQHM